MRGSSWLGCSRRLWSIRFGGFLGGRIRSGWICLFENVGFVDLAFLMSSLNVRHFFRMMRVVGRKILRRHVWPCLAEAGLICLNCRRAFCGKVTSLCMGNEKRMRRCISDFQVHVRIHLLLSCLHLPPSHPRPFHVWRGSRIRITEGVVIFLVFRRYQVSRGSYKIMTTMRSSRLTFVFRWRNHHLRHRRFRGHGNAWF